MILRSFRFWASLITLVLLVCSAIIAYSILKKWRKSLPPPAAASKLALSGVSNNQDWKPVMRLVKGFDMALVPAGCFKMGSTDQQLEAALDSCERFFGSGKCQVDFVQSESPAHQVCFEKPYWIAITEITNRQYGSSSSTDMVSMYRGPNWPRETVTWLQARQFCADHGLRLPSEAEWEFAARGPDNLIYPWGDDFDLEKTISGRLSPQDVGSVPDGASWVGAFDLSGGVSEWVEDVYTPYSPANQIESNVKENEQPRVLRGGSWFSFAAFMLRSTYRERTSSQTANSTIGFRCAADFE